MTWDDAFIFNAFHALLTATALLHYCSEGFRLYGYGYGYDFMSPLFNDDDTLIKLFVISVTVNLLPAYNVHVACLSTHCFVPRYVQL